MNHARLYKSDHEVDPAYHATNEQKGEAFEWLRSVSVSDSEDAEHAAVLMYEIARLKC